MTGKSILANALCWLGVVALSWAVLPGPAQCDEVGFNSDRWSLVAADTSQHLGRTALKGIAWLEDVVFENGLIEVDIAVTSDRQRSYPGLVFRRQSPGDYERFYIRPHRSALYADVLQYTPVFKGVAGWQLYNGDGATAVATIPVGRWFHLKMEIQGSQARVYVDGAEEPELVITELKHGLSRGPIGVFGPRDGTAYFSNFSYILTDSLQFDAPAEVVPAFGAIKEWELSDPVSSLDIDIEKTPYELGLDELNWTKVSTEPSGLLDISRHFVWDYLGANLVWARATVHSDVEQVREYTFGYSDAVVLFMNGQLMFSGVSTYQGRDPSFLGIIGYNDAVYLPLKEGDNELLVAVNEAFGGWGLMVRDADTVFQAPGVSRLWEIKENIRFPESAVYDGENDVLYVSCYFNAVIDLQWVAGMNRPTGLAIRDGKLYAVERRSLAQIDITTGEILKRFTIEGAVFPNDIAFDEAGNGYITDNTGSVLYKFADDTITVWLQNDDVIAPNGIYFDEGRLLVGCTGDGCLKAVDLESKRVVTVASLGRGSIMDGITPDGRGNFFVSDFNGRIFRVTRAGEKTEIINSSSPTLYTADITYIPEKNLLIVPRLYSNELTAYTVEL